MQARYPLSVIRDDFLTNTAYGFPSRGHARRVAPRILAVVHITANLGSAQNQRDYANRPSSPGPSAHYYIDRDGGGIHAVDETRFAAWSNGDLKSPRMSNAGIVYLVRLNAEYNANEGCYLEIECVGTATESGQWTEAQFATVAGLIADAARDTGLPIDDTTVLPHAYINTIDRAHCPSLNVAAHMAKLVALAKGDDMGMSLTLPAIPVSGTLRIPKGTQAYRVADRSSWETGADAIRAAYRVSVAGGSSGYLVDLHDDTAHFIYTGSLPPDAFTPAIAPDCAAQIKAAIVADRESARIVYPT